MPLLRAKYTGRGQSLRDDDKDRPLRTDAAWRGRPYGRWPRNVHRLKEGTPWKQSVRTVSHTDAGTEFDNRSRPQLTTGWIRIGAISGTPCLCRCPCDQARRRRQPDQRRFDRRADRPNLGAHPDRTLASNALTIVALALALWFGVTLAHLVGERDRTSPLGTIIQTGAICIFITGALDAITQSALVFLAKEDSLTAAPQLTRLVYVLYDGPIQPGIMGLAIAIFLIAVGVAALRRTIAARWIGWLSLTFALISTVGAIQGLTVTNGGNLAPGALGVLGDLLITVIVSLYLLRRPTQPKVDRDE